MAKYLFDKYEVTYSPWSSERYTREQKYAGGLENYLWKDVYWDGTKYVGVEPSGLYPAGASGWQFNNDYLLAYRENWSGGNYTYYDISRYERKRNASPTSLIQRGIIGTANEFPTNGFLNGFWYVRTGILNAPKITSPNGGETIDDLFTINFTDSEPIHDIRYHIQLSTNDGLTWSDIVSLTNVGVTSYNFNSSSVEDTSTAKVRIRAFDGVAYGVWDESDGVFTIQHNKPPTTPTRLSPRATVIDRNKTHPFTWKHNDAEPQSKAELEWRMQGTAGWTTYTSNGPEEVYYISGNTFPNGQIEWRVRTYDQKGLVSPDAAIAVFTVAEPTATPTITKPDSLVNIPRPTIEWINGAQSSYQIVIVDSIGVTFWDSGEIISTNKALTVGKDLLNGATYTIKVRVKDGSGLFSSFTEKAITVSTTSPAKSKVTAFSSNGFIALSISTPSPVGSQPSVISHEVYKRVGDDWIRIAFGINSSFNDYRVKNGEVYEYFVKAIGDNGTTSTSDVVSQSITFKGSWIYALQDPEATLKQFRINGRGYNTSIAPESSIMKFAGRKRPVIHFSDYEDYSLTIKIQAIKDMNDMEVLRRFVMDREAICYRDTDGHLIVGHILSLGVEKERRVSSTTITVIETDFNEEV